MTIDDPWHEWAEITNAKEMSEGRRTFIRGRTKYPPIQVTPEAIDAFERSGADTRAGLIAALKQLGMPVKE